MQVFCIMVILRDHKKSPGDDLGFSVPGFESSTNTLPAATASRVAL